MKTGARLAVMVATTYLAVSGLWIVLSDRLVEVVFRDPRSLALAQTWKGLAFVLLSAALLGAFIWWYERERDRDVAELRRAEAELRASEQRFSRFLDHSPLPAWITGADGKVLWSSKGFRDRAPGGDPDALLKQGGHAVFRFPADDRGEHTGFIAADLTDRVRDAEELRDELSTLMGAVSHDLRAPLRSMTGFTQALREDHADRLDESARHYLQRIQDAGEMMGRLIDGLLELSGVGRQDVQRRNVDLATVARAEVERLRTAQPTRRVDAQIPASIPVVGDPKLLKQAMQHLIGNAWKFTAASDDARIEVSCVREDGKDVVTITDNGEGFDMAYAHKLFTPFQRLHGPNDFSGMGIGLAVTQRIIQRHGGSIWLESSPGTGTTVRFTLG